MVATGVAVIAFAVLLSAGRAQVPSATGANAASVPGDYWRLPLQPQGEAPAHWSDIERSLAPESCAECHEEKYQEWRTSVHAAALSPGLVGQLLGYDAGQTASCMECHAPLAEQRQAFEAARQRGVAHLASGQGLAAAGLACPACHVRGQRRFGPPQRETNVVGQSDADGPHGGVHRAAWFEDAEFCAACHQFPEAYAINGKPMENTYVEWQASPQAAEGVTCQGCHMPDRKHLWRGIHDPEMVASGLTARFFTDAEGARFELTNSGVGHAFPTYVTPKVVMRAVALDGRGEPRPRDSASHTIQRVVAYTRGGWVEYSDSRLLPARSASLHLPWNGSERIRMWLEVHPDDYYDHQVYDPLLKRLPSKGQAARLLSVADSMATASRYRLFETELDRPQ